MKHLAALALMLLLGIPLGICLAFACDPLSSRRDAPEWLSVAAIEELKCDGILQPRI